MTTSGRIASLLAVLAVTSFIYKSNKSDTHAPLPTPITELPTPILEVDDLLVKVDEKEFECLRTSIYFETRNQKSDDAFLASGFSVINRMETRGYPDTACGVVQEKRRSRSTGRMVCMYSWYCDGKPDTPPLYTVKSGRQVPNVMEIRAWERASELAMKILKNEVDNPIGNATLYHATYVKPNWDFKKLRVVAKIEDHIFYETI